MIKLQDILTEAGFKNLSPFEYKLRLALKDEEKEVGKRGNKPGFEKYIQELRKIQLVKVLGRGKLKSSEEKTYKQIINKYKLKEGKLTEIYPLDALKKINKAKPGTEVKFAREVWTKMGKPKNSWLCKKGPEKGVIADDTVVAQRIAKSKKSFKLEGKLNEFEGRPIPMDTPNEFAYLTFKKFAYKKRGQYKKDMLKHVRKSDGQADSSKMFMTASSWWYKWAYHNNKAYTHIKDKLKFGRALMVMMVKDDLIFSKKAWKKNNKITNIK